MAGASGFGAMGVDAPCLDGPRYRLFSMLAVSRHAAWGGCLIRPADQAELASGELVVTCARPLRGDGPINQPACEGAVARAGCQPAPGLATMAGLAHRGLFYKRPRLALKVSFADRWTAERTDGMYGISAVRCDAFNRTLHHRVLMGLLAADGRCWESAPVPVRRWSRW